MSRRSTVIAILIVCLLSACRAVTPGSPGSAGPARPSTAPPNPTAPGTRASPSPSACDLGMGIAEYAYPGLREFVRQFQGMSGAVAVAEVVSVGELQYATESGERPSCEEIAAAEAVFSIGRMVEVRVVTPVGGTVREGQALSYLFQGGSLGRDTSPGHPLGVELPTEGDRMLVLSSRDPIDVDPGTGTLEVGVLEMFPITPEGRVVTPDPAENVTLDRVADLLRDVIPSPPPSS